MYKNISIIKNCIKIDPPVSIPGRKPGDVNEFSTNTVAGNVVKMVLDEFSGTEIITGVSCLIFVIQASFSYVCN